MYVISFRIPVSNPFGHRLFVNGAASSTKRRYKGEGVLVSGQGLSLEPAEVIECASTYRNDFKYRLTEI